MTKQDIAKLVENIHFDYGDDVTVRVLDDLKKIGFSYSTKAGVSALISDLVIAPKKNELIEKAEQEVNEVERLYMDGAITNGERKSKIIGMKYKFFVVSERSEQNYEFEDCIFLID